MNTKIQNLVKRLLMLLIEKEKKSSNPKFYWTFDEFDSNNTPFEELANARLIVVRTKLSKKYVKVVKIIFQAIYDKNYWIFEDIDVAIDMSTKSSEFAEEDLKSYENAKLWLKLLKSINSANVRKSEIKPEIDVLMLTESPTTVEALISESETQTQKIYKIKDILNI